MVGASITQLGMVFPQIESLCTPFAFLSSLHVHQAINRNQVDEYHNCMTRLLTGPLVDAKKSGSKKKEEDPEDLGARPTRAQMFDAAWEKIREILQSLPPAPAGVAAGVVHLRRLELGLVAFKAGIKSEVKTRARFQKMEEKMSELINKSQNQRKRSRGRDKSDSDKTGDKGTGKKGSGKKGSGKKGTFRFTCPGWVAGRCDDPTKCGEMHGGDIKIIRHISSRDGLGLSEEKMNELAQASQ